MAVIGVSTCVNQIDRYTLCLDFGLFIVDIYISDVYDYDHQIQQDEMNFDIIAK